MTPGAPRRRQVLGMLCRRGMKLVLAGIVIGLAAALALSRLVESLPLEVTAFDPTSYSAAVMLLPGVVAGLLVW